MHVLERWIITKEGEISTENENLDYENSIRILDMKLEF